MIKLVVTDIDGTLIPEGTDTVNPLLFDCIRRLKEKGIMFVVASGRQYVSMEYVFEPVKNDVIFISANGTSVMCRGRIMSADYIDEAIAREVVTYMKASKEDISILISTPETVYIDHEDKALRALMVDGYHERMTVVEDVMPYCSCTNKISIYRKEGSAPLAEGLIRKFGDRVSVMQSGEPWIDFISLTADKGNALSSIQEMMHISVEETMAFGDNCNDIGMLNRAGESYAVANANPQVKEAARYIAPANTEDGVIRVIQERLL
jgi:hypothetical protein